MTLIELLVWLALVTACAGAGQLAGGGPGALVGSCVPAAVLGASWIRDAVRSHRPKPLPEPRRAWVLTRRQALVEVWARPGVRPLATVAVVLGVPVLIALVATEAPRRTSWSLGWPELPLVMALVSLAALAVGAGAVSIGRSLHRREREMSWTKDDATFRTPAATWTSRRSALVRTHRRALVVVTSEAGATIAIPRDVAADALEGGAPS